MNQPKYPGIRVNINGTTGAGSLEALVSDVAAFYPITPSSSILYLFAQAAADGKKNAFGRYLKCLQAESEHSSFSAMEEAGLTGVRVTNATSSVGLILAKEVLYPISYKGIPAVVYIGTRALSTQALNIFDDHSDIMGVLDTGWGMLFARNVQQVLDFGQIGRKTAELSHTPFFIVQSGFYGTHTTESCLFPETELIREYLGDRFPDKDGFGKDGELLNLLHPKHGLMMGTVQGPEHYFDAMAAQRECFGAEFVMKNIQQAMGEFKLLTGRNYSMVENYQTEDADHIMVLLNSHIADTAMATVDYLRKQGKKVGVQSIISFSPINADQIYEGLKNAKAVTVVEKVDHKLSYSNPLTSTIKNVLFNNNKGRSGNDLPVYPSTVGLGGVEFTPEMAVAIFKHMEQKKPEKFFYVGAIHSPLSIGVGPPLNLLPKNSYTYMGGSLGGLGAVGTNDFLGDLVDELTKEHTANGNISSSSQFGAEKMGQPTMIMTTVADEPIRLHCAPNSIHAYMAMIPAALEFNDDLEKIQESGTLVFESAYRDPHQIYNNLPDITKNAVQSKKLNLIAIDASAISKKYATPELKERMKGIAYSGALLRDFIRVSEGKEILWDELQQRIEGKLKNKFGKKGVEIVAANLNCVKEGYTQSIFIPYQTIQTKGDG